MSWWRELTAGHWWDFSSCFVGTPPGPHSPAVSCPGSAGAVVTSRMLGLSLLIFLAVGLLVLLLLVVDLGD